MNLSGLHSSALDEFFRQPIVVSPCLSHISRCQAFMNLDLRLLHNVVIMSVHFRTHLMCRFSWPGLWNTQSTFWRQKRKIYIGKIESMHTFYLTGFNLKSVCVTVNLFGIVRAMCQWQVQPFMSTDKSAKMPPLFGKCSSKYDFPGEWWLISRVRQTYVVIVTKLVLYA